MREVDRKGGRKTRRHKDVYKLGERGAEEGREAAQSEGKDKNGEREGSESSRGVNPASVWPGIIYANIITSPTSSADKQRG